MHEGEKQPMMKIQEKTKDEADYGEKQRDKHRRENLSEKNVTEAEDNDKEGEDQGGKKIGKGYTIDMSKKFLLKFHLFVFVTYNKVSSFRLRS